MLENTLGRQAHADECRNEPEHDEAPRGNEQSRRQAGPGNQQGADGAECNGQHEEHDRRNHIECRDHRSERVCFELLGRERRFCTDELTRLAQSELDELGGGRIAETRAG
jgi:hypothetical protein